jgi:hypothetical protein
MRPPICGWRVILESRLGEVLVVVAIDKTTGYAGET